MRRFAQSKDKPVIPQSEPSYEAQELQNLQKQIKEIEKSQKDVISFCKDIKTAGEGLKRVASKIPSPYFLYSSSLSNIGDKFIEIGNKVPEAITTKINAEIGLNVAGSVAPFVQTVSKSPGLKRAIPIIGDYTNYRYTKTLTVQKDLIDPIERIFALYKCDKSHAPTNAPVMNGLLPNFFDHPELDEQHRAKTQSVAEMVYNLGSIIQNFEALAAWISIALALPELAVLIRSAGTAVQLFLLLIHVIFSPNTADITMYSLEGFKGGGIDPKSPFAVLNKIPGISEYIKRFESKPIAEEATKANEKRVENLILSEIIKKGDTLANGIDKSPLDFAVIKDTQGNEEYLGVGDTWNKWHITITGIYPDHVEYKDQHNNRYSIRELMPSFATKDKSPGPSVGKEFLAIMQEAANLSTSGVKGDVRKLLSKKMSFIISLVYQLKPKYPWIGDAKNAKWINLQSDILSHIIRPIKRTTVKPVKPTKHVKPTKPVKPVKPVKPPVTRPYRSPVNPNQTPVRTDDDTRLPGMSDLDF